MWPLHPTPTTQTGPTFLRAPTLVYQRPKKDGDPEGHDGGHAVNGPVHLVQLPGDWVPLPGPPFAEQRSGDHDDGDDRLGGAEGVAPVGEVDQPPRVAVGVRLRLNDRYQPCCQEEDQDAPSEGEVPEGHAGAALPLENLGRG